MHVAIKFWTGLVTEFSNRYLKNDPAHIFQLTAELLKSNSAKITNYTSITV